MSDKGIKLLTWVGRAAIKRHAQTLPRSRPLTLIIRRGAGEYLAYWYPWNGYQFRAWRASRPGRGINDWDVEWEKVEMPIKRRVAPDAPLQFPDLPSVTKLFAKLPTLVAFITARSYDDGAARVPGKFWVDASSAGFTVTLIDIDQALRLTVRAGTIDDAFAAAESLLGAENAPWEVDQFQAEKRAEKMKKKK